MPEISRTLRIAVCGHGHAEGVRFPIQLSMNAHCKREDCDWIGEPNFLAVELPEKKKEVEENEPSGTD